MHHSGKFQKLEEIVLNVLRKGNARIGQSFPYQMVCAGAAKEQLSRNDVTDYVQELKNHRLLTADERLTEGLIKKAGLKQVAA